MDTLHGVDRQPSAWCELHFCLNFNEWTQLCNIQDLTVVLPKYSESLMEIQILEYVHLTANFQHIVVPVV